MSEHSKKEKLPANHLKIYGYTDYRKYLKEFYENRKSSHKGYSYRAFSKAAGFSSPNFLKLVIEGKRNISSEATQKFIKALGLKGKSAEYFDCLVQMNQAKNDQLKEDFFHELKKLTPHAHRRELDAESLQYLSHWIYPVLRDMVDVFGFRDDPYWLMRRIHGDLSHQDVSSAFQFLAKSDFIRKDDEGKWHANDKMVSSSDEVRSLAVRNYHRQMLERAKESLERLPLEEREFGALTFVIAEKRLEELKKKLKDFRSELHDWAVQTTEQDPGEVVVQVNFQMYPQTKKVQ